MRIISIEGNIGSGKSTLIKNLKELNLENIIFLPEPVEEWNKIKDTNGKTIIEKYYEDQKKYAFSFQMMAYISRLKQIQDNINENNIIITERCLYTDKEIFAKMLHDSGLIEDIEYSIYLCWFEHFIADAKINHFIYIKSDPDICSNRINLRNRKGEESIPLEYLIKCHKYHENWLNNKKEVLFLNGNEEYSDKIPEEWLNLIKNFIKIENK
jgi:deoxyadenosine/deoxycytidine kinase